MDEQGKEHADTKNQTGQPGEKNGGLQTAASGDKPQHSMTTHGGPEVGGPDEPKEAVGGPKTPGKAPERMPEHERDSESKV